MKPAASLREILRDVAGRLDAVSESPRLDAELLTARAIDVPRSYLFTHPDDEPDAAALARLEANVERRLAGEPMAYITGVKEFWSLDLAVTPATLVPRPETELLVAEALKRFPTDRAVRILDLGTGSGAIAIAIASERPLADVTATDRSEAALGVARENARLHDLGNIRFLAGNWTRPVSGEQFDVIVSNPPYIEADDKCLATLAAEPREALVAGADGLDAIRTLARDCIEIVADDGWLLLEHGATQAEDVASLLAASGWRDIDCHKDLAGLPRISVARRIAAT